MMSIESETIYEEDIRPKIDNRPIRVYSSSVPIHIDDFSKLLKYSDVRNDGTSWRMVDIIEPEKSIIRNIGIPWLVAGNRFARIDFCKKTGWIYFWVTDHTKSMPDCIIAHNFLSDRK